MKPAPFAYLRPSTLEEALAALAGEQGAKVLAGGQSLVPLLSMRLAAPSMLVDINALPDLGHVRVAEDGVRVGALARHAEVLASAEAAQAQPLLGMALSHVAHPTIRNRGTTVGSIVHADAAAEMPMVLRLLEGSVDVASVRGRRTIPAAELFAGPLESTLAHDEIAVEAFFPGLAPGAGVAFQEIARRHGDYALVGVAAHVETDGEAVTRARVGFVSVSDVPVVVDVTDAVQDPAGDPAARGPGRARPRRGHPCHRRLPDPPREGAGAARPGGRDRPRPFAGRRGDPPVTTEQLHDVRLHVNGSVHEVQVPARRLLSDALRHDCGLTGTHVGCEHGVCGACTVLVDGTPMRSCLMLAVSAVDAEITTVEGLTEDDGSAQGRLSPVQQAFSDCHGLQCGFCTPGFLTTITAGLRETPDPTEDEAREMIAGNLCRCTGYQNIVKSVLRASEIVAERERGDA